MKQVKRCCCHLYDHYPPYAPLYAMPYTYEQSPYYMQPIHQTQPLNKRMDNSYSDHGHKPFVTNIQQATNKNDTFRTAIWTGKHLQVTLMSIPISEDIGLEVHETVDQFLRIEMGHGYVQMGKSKDHLNVSYYVHPGDAIFVPAGVWHNLTNISNVPLKLYSIYAPPEHPFGTIHVTKQDEVDLP